MKLRIFTAACLLTLLCAAAETAAQRPRPAPAGRRPAPLKLPSTLVCRTGGNMTWTFHGQFGVMQTQLGGKQVRVPVVEGLHDQIKFQKSAEPVKPDASNLQPGFCGLTNRAMTASDPDTVFYLLEDGFTIHRSVIWQDGFFQGDKTTVLGGALNLPGKQPFSIKVTLYGGSQWQVVPGTKPAALE